MGFQKNGLQREKSRNSLLRKIDFVIPYESSMSETQICFGTQQTLLFSTPIFINNTVIFAKLFNRIKMEKYFMTIMILP